MQDSNLRIRQLEQALRNSVSMEFHNAQTQALKSKLIEFDVCPECLRHITIQRYAAGDFLSCCEKSVLRRQL